MRGWADRTRFLVLVAALATCGRRPSPAPGAFLTDDAGRVVQLAEPARRIVSLSPATSELVFALGAGDRLVGRTTWCDFPPEVRSVPSVGDGLDPNVDAIAAQHPDLVLLYRSAHTETAAAQLTRLGITAVVLRQDRLADIAHAARLVGRLTGRVAAGDSLARSLEQLVATPPSGTASGPRLTFVVWDNPPSVIGAGSYLDELATLAGARNVFHDIGAAAATVSLETIAVRDPDVIVVVRDRADRADRAELPGYARRPEWQTIRAVRERRFVTLPGSLFGRPSPRAAQAVAELRRRLEAVQ